jgi:hypothetical protein
LKFRARSLSILAAVVSLTAAVFGGSDIACSASAKMEPLPFHFEFESEGWLDGRGFLLWQSQQGLVHVPLPLLIFLG